MTGVGAEKAGGRRGIASPRAKFFAYLQNKAATCKILQVQSNTCPPAPTHPRLFAKKRNTPSGLTKGCHPPIFFFAALLLVRAVSMEHTLMALDLSALESLDESTLRGWSAEDVAYLLWQTKWAMTARPNQLPPETLWTETGFMAGRGFGKTRVGAEWLGAASFEDPDAFPSAVIAPTYGDVKFTCFEGPAGLLNVIPKELIVRYNSSDMIIEMKTRSGKTTTIRGFTAEKPERLRGPQHARIWGDELSSWAYDEETWDMAMMGLRLGNNPQILWTTTPKPKELVRKLIEPKKGRFIVRGSTFENKANLPDSFFAQLEQYEGTTLGRQELYGELIDPEESGIIKRSWFRLWPAKKPLPQLDWIIMSMDTAFTEATFDKKNGADFSACVVMGVFQQDGVANLIMLDCWAEQLGLPELMKRVKRELQNRYGDDEDTAVIRPMFGSAKPLTSGRAPDILLIEDKGSGISLRQMLAREGIEAYAYNPGRADKLSRLHIVSPVFAQRRVWLPESDKFKGRPKTWIDPMLAQLCAFTGAGSIKHDDYVDAVSQGVRLCLDKGLVSTVKAAEERNRRVDDEERRSAPREYQNPYAA